VRRDTSAEEGLRASSLCCRNFTGIINLQSAGTHGVGDWVLSLVLLEEEKSGQASWRCGVGMYAWPLNHAEV
jgi:hypothetical protein